MITKNLNASPESESLLGFIVRSTPRGSSLLELGDYLTIGRDGSNQLVIDDVFVSGRHARIERKNNQFILRDQRSRNGTFLNGARVVEALLKDQDRIHLGDTALIFSCTREDKNLALGMTSKNIHWYEQLRRLPSIAKSTLPVLITGPSGTGKELLAQAIHQRSSRAMGPLICVNCSAMSEGLIESELFGHVRGSFTGATHDRRGAFESARGGTIFLDEIGDLPLSLQPKLLRTLENGEIRPVGSDRTLHTDVRVISATHQDLKRRTQAGLFRSDLYFRLNVARIHSPSLRERIEDFEDLIYFFARENRVRFSVAALTRLKAHAWPGNIRELKNAVARARALFGTEQIEVEHIGHLIDESTTGASSEFVPHHPPSRHPGRDLPFMKEVELELIQERLVANQGNQRLTASQLGLPKSTLHDRIRSYGIDIKKLLADRGIDY